MVEILASDAHIFTTLIADTPLRILFGGNVIVYSDMAPKNPPDFYIIFQVPSAIDVATLGGRRFMSDLTYSIIVVGKLKPYSFLKPIFERVDLLMEQTDWVVSDGANVGGYIRQSSLRYTDELDGVMWSYLGGIYKTLVSEV